MKKSFETNLDDALYNIIQKDIKSFESYREEAEGMDIKYIHLVSELNNYNEDLVLPHMSQLIYEGIFFESVTDLARLFVRFFIDTVVQNPKVSFNDIVTGFFGNKKNFIDLKAGLTKTIQAKRQDLKIADIQNIVNKVVDSYMQYDFKKQIALIQRDLNDIDDLDYRYILGDVYGSQEVMNAVAAYIDEQMKSTISDDVRTMFTKIKDIVTNDVKGIVKELNVEEGDQQSIKLAAVFTALRDSGAMQHIYQVFVKCKPILDTALAEAGDIIGDKSGDDVRQENIILAKRATIAYITLTSILTFASSLSKEVQEQQLQEDEDVDKNNQQPTAQQREEQKQMQENILRNALVRILNEEIYNEYESRVFNEFVIRPIKFTKNLLVKLVTVMSFQELLQSYGKFERYVRRYMVATPYNIEKMRLVLQRSGLDIDTRVIESVVENGINTANIPNAKEELFKFLKNKNFVTRLTFQLMKEYGVKQSLGAKFGHLAAAVVGSIKNILEPADLSVSNPEKQDNPTEVVDKGMTPLQRRLATGINSKKAKNTIANQSVGTKKFEI